MCRQGNLHAARVCVLETDRKWFYVYGRKRNHRRKWKFIFGRNRKFSVTFGQKRKRKGTTYTTLYGSISTTIRSMMDFSMRCNARWSSGHCFDRSVDAAIDSCTSVGVALTCSSNFVFFAGGSALRAFSFAEYETNCSLWNFSRWTFNPDTVCFAGLSLPNDSCFEHSVHFALLASVSDLQNHSQIWLRNIATNELQTRNDDVTAHCTVHVYSCTLHSAHV